MSSTEKIARRLTSGCTAILVCTCATMASAQVSNGSSTEWLAGKKLAESKFSPVSVSWTDSPIRSQFQEFSRQRQIAIFVDRRVDPNIKLTHQFRDRTTEQIVWQTAASNGLGVAKVGNLLYVGPKNVACRLAESIRIAKKALPKNARKKWNGRSEIQWSRGTTTKEIFDWFAKSHGLKFSSPIPHDVWPSADLCSLSLLEQISLALVGFDKSLQFADDGSSVSFCALPEISSASIKIRMARNEKIDLDTAKRTFPHLKIRSSGKTIAVSGPIEEIAEFESWTVAKRTARNAHQSIKTFDLNTTARRMDVLAKVAQWTGRQLSIDDDSREALNSRVTLALTGVSLEILLDKCLDGSGCKFQFEGNKLRILRDAK